MYNKSYLFSEPVIGCVNKQAFTLLNFFPAPRAAVIACDKISANTAEYIQEGRGVAF
jgi:hypothetical protein